MSIENENRHKHAGKSSREFLNPEEIIDAIGIRKGDNVLDIGCGNGYVSLYATSRVGEDGVVYAVDSDPTAIDLLKKVIKHNSLKNIIALREDVTEGLSIPHHCIDICLMANVFHGFVMNKELNDVFRVVNQLLRDHCKLVIVDFKKGVETPGPPQEIRVDIKEVTQVLLPYGFEHMKTYSPGPYHYGLSFVKSPK